MKLFDLDSPLMQGLGKLADLMWLNILTMVCCIPIVTAGASLTAMHYMALKIVRNEECYITRDFFKSFKTNFKQGTIIWLIYLVAILVLVGDFYIMKNSGLEFPKALQIALMVAAFLLVFTGTFVFPVLAKFDNTVKMTIKNAFIIGLLQFPKTILMIILNVVPVVVLAFVPQVTPVVFLFGFSAPAAVSALLYNKFFKKIENQVTEANASEEEGSAEEESETEDERIFHDELDEGLVKDTRLE